MIKTKSKGGKGTEKERKPKIESTADPEYADLILCDIQLHGNEQRNPKEWYPELLYNSKLHQNARIFTNRSQTSVYELLKIGTIIEQRFSVSPKTAELYHQSCTSGRKFKIYTPKNGIKILFHESLKERIKAHNRKIGFEELKIMDGHGKLYTLDIVDGTAIVKVLIQ